jgi:hypothetical protein
MPTDLVHKSGPQPASIVVLEQIHAKFDKEAREQAARHLRDAMTTERIGKFRFAAFIFCSPLPATLAKDRAVDTAAVAEECNAHRQIARHLTTGTAHEQSIQRCTGWQPPDTAACHLGKKKPAQAGFSTSVD